ncbi:MAG: GAF domain-containing protein [Xenococcaceae cyanobacterium]
MKTPFSPNQNNDDIFLDVQIEQEEIFDQKNSRKEEPITSEKLTSLDYVNYSQKADWDAAKKHFSWQEITEKRLNIIQNRQESRDSQKISSPQAKAVNSRFFNLEKIKTRTIAIAITMGMLPLILSSGIVYYFGNQAIKEQQFHTSEQNYDLLEEYLDKQRRILLLLLAGTEITAVIIGLTTIWWTKRSIDSVAGVASQNTSLAIEAEKRQQNQILAEIVLHLRQSINSEDIMTNAAFATRKILQCDRVIIYQFEPQGAGKTLAESVNPQYSEILLTYTEDLGLESKYLSHYKQKQSKVINDIYQDSQLSSEHISQYESLDVKSCVHVPLEQQGKVNGLLIAYQCSEFRSWQSKEIELLKLIANEISLALDDAQIVKECLNLQIQLQETSLWQEYLNHSLKCIHSATKEEAIIKIAVEETRRVLQCDRAVFCRLSSPERVTVVTESVGAEYAKTTGLVIEKACFEIEDLQPENNPVRVINDVETADLSVDYQAKLIDLEIKSLIFAPVIYQNQIYGFLMAQQCSWQRCWQEFEIKWFKQIAQQMGYSLNKSKMMIHARDNVNHQPSITTTKPKSQALIPHQLPVFLEESKVTLEKFSQKVLAEVDAVTPIFKQIQVMTKSVEGLTYNINQTKLQSQQVDGILRIEHKNIDLTEDKLLDLQQSLREITIKNYNLEKSCQQFIQATEQIHHLAASIKKQINKTNNEAKRIGIVSEHSLQELTQNVQDSTSKLITQAEAIRLFLREVNGATKQIATTLENNEAQAFVGIEIVQETRQNLNQITIRNQEINQLISRISLAATVGEHNSQLAQQSLLEVANLANQAAKKSLMAVSTIAGLIKFLEKNKT